MLLLLGTIGIAYVTIRKDIFPLLWVAPFFLFLYFLNYGTYFYTIPVLPAFCIALARLILEVPEIIESRIPMRSLQYGITSVLITLRNLSVGIFVGIANLGNKMKETRPARLDISLEIKMIMIWLEIVRRKFTIGMNLFQVNPPERNRKEE